MSPKNQHIDNVSAKVWNDYLSGTILTSDKEKVEAFLSQYPEIAAELKNTEKSDLEIVKSITKNVNYKIDAKIGKKPSAAIWWGTAVILIFGGLSAYYFQKDKQSNIVQEKIINPIKKDELPIEKVVELTEKQDDTLFSFEMKGDKVKVNKSVVANNNTIEDIDVVSIVKRDTLLLKDEKTVSQQQVEKIKTKQFLTQVDYRQSVYVENNFYSQSKTVGKTSSYASPIKGYSYEKEGMPTFKEGDDALLNYINEVLAADNLLKGIQKKMRANLSFVVTNKGKVKDVLVQNCNNRQLGLSLMNIMETMPDWSPSQFKGKKGKAHYVLKIVFE